MPNNDFHLRSQRLRFGLWSCDMLELAERLWLNPEVSRYITASGKFSQVEVKARLQQEIDNQVNFKLQYWPLFDLENHFIGCCGLRPRDSELQVYEIGVHLLPEYWGKNYAYEALETVIEFSRQQKYSKLFAGHNPANQASQQMLLKLNFVWVKNEFYEPTGLEHPSYELVLG